ncbi:MAG: integrase, partial [Actinomycetia bacterium]|nr:integrase [Actinomycetes bacterium]
GRGRARARSTIDHYTAAGAPALAVFAGRYDSLREVSEDDIAAQLEPLRGSARTAAAVALRSLFAILKSRRLIFADPTRRVHPGRFPRRPVLGLDPATRAGLLDQLSRADHRLVVLLAGVHALSRADITGLRLHDVALPAGGGTATLTVHGTRRGLDEPTRAALADWLRERRRRWPATANPHLLISTRSALGLGPVSTGYLRGVTADLPVTLHQLRADRLLAQARDTGGDPLSLHRLFGLSADTALRYCAELDPPEHHATDSR